MPTFNRMLPGYALKFVETTKDTLALPRTMIRCNASIQPIRVKLPDSPTRLGHDRVGVWLVDTLGNNHVTIDAGDTKILKRKEISLFNVNDLVVLEYRGGSSGWFIVESQIEKHEFVMKSSSGIIVPSGVPTLTTFDVSVKDTGRGVDLDSGSIVIRRKGSYKIGSYSETSNLSMGNGSKISFQVYNSSGVRLCSDEVYGDDSNGEQDYTMSKSNIIPDVLAGEAIRVMLFQNGVSSCTINNHELFAREL